MTRIFLHSLIGLAAISLGACATKSDVDALGNDIATLEQTLNAQATVTNSSSSTHLDDQIAELRASTEVNRREIQRLSAILDALDERLGEAPASSLK